MFYQGCFGIFVVFFFKTLRRTTTINCCIRPHTNYLIQRRHYRSLYINTFKMGNKEMKSTPDDPIYKTAPNPEVTFTKEELKSKLTEEEYHITQEKGTERAYTGKHVNVSGDGSFTCVVCDNVLFKTDKKFESGSGWPSFTDVSEKGNVVKIEDRSHGMVRIEAACAKCGSHLGHVFDDGPKEDTGLRYCVNSASLKFQPKE